jgi:pyruvate dehydrogenase E1 component alpha subunit
MASVTGAAAPSDWLQNDEIGLDRRLELFRLQVEIRDCEARSIFLQNMIKGTSHLSLGQRLPRSASLCARTTSRSALTAVMRIRLPAGLDGGRARQLMLRDIGLMRGKGGSMHLTPSSTACSAPMRLSARTFRSPAARLGARNISATRTCQSVSSATATNIGAFHGLQLRRSLEAPVIFVCENTWQEYTPIGDVTAVKHPAGDRAAAYGLERIVVDGNDADLVYRTALAALEKAREGDGPSLIEYLTYRHSGHSRADPAKYRPPGELEEWMKRDPVVIYRQRLKEFGVADETIGAIEA